jgi:hypothetical protein
VAGFRRRHVGASIQTAWTASTDNTVRDAQRLPFLKVFGHGGFLQNPAVTILAESHRTARRVALIGMAVSAMLACSNIIIGLLTNSTSVVATGFEFAGDVLASSGGSGYR